MEVASLTVLRPGGSQYGMERQTQLAKPVCLVSPALALPDFPNPFGRLQVVPAHILLNHLPSVFEHLSSVVKPRTPHGASACRHIHRGASYNAALRAYARFAGLI